MLCYILKDYSYICSQNSVKQKNRPTVIRNNKLLITSNND